ncbi:MAG TPA: hypothetical protein VNM49_06125 [Paenibacillus cookii]|jgi:hypothetical protein|uniref:TM2 domain-containing protein n=1 Tax=Paenibacillus cookii TaxID=157839 RepID=A0ABQ4LW56_9BACL|nr:hypothetical protein [Paenibacillus cookii]KHF37699.1 hypothetical protein CM49_00219 [Paenibacillus sp. P1XP2]GIO67521.1 hypothetical protein J21TS3_23420 [Paenibacillus cookii]HWO53949.1 hypothetical protein [Paenibacillus cookii]
MIKKSRWLTFLLAMIPGVGHLYLGFTKQGLQMMIGAAACIILIPSIPMIFSFALAILWFYQLFDALQKAAWMKAAALEQERMMMGQETFGYPWTMQDLMAMGGYPRENQLNPVWTGIGCVIVGAAVLLMTIFPALWHWLLQQNTASVLLAVALIGYGLRLLLKKPDRRGSESL